MRVLIVSDEEERLLYEAFRKERVEGVELIISCGDLHAGYLDFLMTMVNVPMVYVMGNHDNALVENPPLGAESLEGRIVKINGYRIAGLGGSIKYNNKCINMYTEREMAWRCFKLWVKSWFTGGIDIFVTHAPAQGYGHLKDYPHKGFECFNKFLMRTKPMYMFHGHVHRNYSRRIKDQYEHPSGTIIMNCCNYKIIDIPPVEKKKKDKKNDNKPA